MKNKPARERPALRSRSSYSNPQRDGGPKASYMYPSWVTEKRDPPQAIRASLALARANPRAFKPGGTASSSPASSA